MIIFWIIFYSFCATINFYYFLLIFHVLKIAYNTFFKNKILQKMIFDPSKADLESSKNLKIKNDFHRYTYFFHLIETLILIKWVSKNRFTHRFLCVNSPHAIRKVQISSSRHTFSDHNSYLFFHIMI